MKNKITLLSAVMLFIGSSVFCQNKTQSIGIGEISIIEQVGNDLWAGSASQGIGYYNSSSGTWTYYNHTNTPQFASDSITSIVSYSIGGNNKVYFGTTNGVVEFKNGVWSVPTATAGKYICGLSLAMSDTMWVATRNEGLIMMDQTFNLVRSYTTSNSLIPSTQIKGGQNGGRSCRGYCYGTQDSGMFYTRSGGRYFAWDTSAAHFGMVDNHVTSVWTDISCSPAKWVIGTEAGLSICTDTFPCINFTTRNGLSQNNITSLSQDCRGNMWIGTADSGVMMYNFTSFTRITTANGLTSNKVTAICFAAGSCTGYVSTADGNIALLDTNGRVDRVMTSVEKISSESFKVTVYPQPASGIVTFAFGKTISTGELILTDLSGRTVVNTTLRETNTANLNVSALPTGLYLYHTSISGQMVKTGKIMVVN
jgi:ligand-binding sensor domain-containing protein